MLIEHNFESAIHELGAEEVELVDGGFVAATFAALAFVAIVAYGAIQAYEAGKSSDCNQ